MITAEFSEIQRILNGRYKICADGTDALRWYEELKGYDFSVVKEAVNDWISNDGWKPEIINIVNRCNDVVRWRKQIRAAAVDPNEKTVRCPHCKDTGLIVTVTPTGVRVGSPCTFCSKGRENYPWEFLSEDEKQAYNEKEIKAGRSVPRYHEAPKEFRDLYLYGVKK